MRGRLIFPYLVGLRRLSTTSTAADPDGAGELTSGYDETFRESHKILSDPDDQIGVSARIELAELQVLAQIEPEQYERLETMISGDSPNSRFSIVLHARELEQAGLLESSGRPKIHKGDRLAAIYNHRSGALIETIPNPPGLFVIQVQSGGWGLGPERNLFLVVFEERETSTREV
jgi:hypothetical protein